MATKQIKDFTEKTSLDSTDQILIQDAAGVTKKALVQNLISGDNVIYVRKLADLPAASGGVITLGAKDYIFIGTIDLLGSRLSTTSVCSIQGLSSETSILKSTGLSVGSFLITTTKTMPIRNISINSGSAKAISINALGTGAYDWFAVNFVSCATIGTIQNIDNLLLYSCAFINSAGLTIDGTVNTLAGESCFATGISGTLITIKSTCSIARRLRFIFSSFVATSGNTFLTIESTGTIPVDQFILVRCNFSGGGTYISGVTAADNISDWEANKGISNSRTNGKLSMTANATATVTPSPGTYVKVAGTTTANALNQRFTHANNRLTYTGAISNIFTIEVIASLSSGNNNVIAIRIAKNGTTISTSQSTVTTSGTGVVENFSCSDLVELNTNDYIEVFVANTSAGVNITVSDLSLNIRN